MYTTRPEAERAVFIYLNGLCEIMLIPYNDTPSSYLETIDGNIGKLIKVSSLDVLYYEEIPKKRLFEYNAL